MATPEFWERVLSIAQKLDSMSYYQLLELSTDATSDAVRAAHYRLARLLHPDRHVRESDPVRRRAINRVYARMSEAHRALSNPGQRADYDRGLADGATRLSTSPRRSRSAGQDPASPSARKLYDTANQLLASGQRRAAHAQLALAAQLEPGSAAIAQALAACAPDADSKPQRQVPAARPASAAARGPSAVALDDAPTNPAAAVSSHRSTGGSQYEPPVPTITESDLFDSGIFEESSSGERAIELTPSPDLRKRGPKR